MYGLDLFSGIGGITKALEGYVQPVAYCENDRYAQATLLSRMSTADIPMAPIWDDVRTLHGSPSLGIEIIYGGFPCQDISVAGRGEGLGGKRSGLFSEIVRLLSEIRPRFVFLENVPAIRSRGGDVVTGRLAGLGYDCRWDVLSAHDVGANHRRERWWLLAYAKSNANKHIPQSRLRNDVAVCGQDVADALRGRRDGQPGNKGQGQAERGRAGEAGKDVADSDAIRRDGRAGLFGSGRGREPENGGWWATEPDLGRVANGIPFRVDRLRALGNSVVPAQAREAFERLCGLK